MSIVDGEQRATVHLIRNTEEVMLRSLTAEQACLVSDEMFWYLKELFRMLIILLTC